MKDISFLDLEKNEDIYNIIMKYLIKPSGRYTPQGINDFENYTKANKRALLDPFIKKFISQCVIIKNINNYFRTVDDFRDTWKCAFNMNNELHNYIIDNMNDNSIYSYDSINHIIFDTNYFEFDFNIKKIL